MPGIACTDQHAVLIIAVPLQTPVVETAVGGKRYDVPHVVGPLDREAAPLETAMGTPGADDIEAPLPNGYRWLVGLVAGEFSVVEFGLHPVRALLRSGLPPFGGEGFGRFGFVVRVRPRVPRFPEESCFLEETHASRAQTTARREVRRPTPLPSANELQAT